MSVDSATSRDPEGAPSQLSRRQARALKRRSQEVQAEARISTVKLDALNFIRSLALSRIAVASEQEAQIVQALPSSVDRAQFIVDEVTHAIGGEIKTLSQRLRHI